MDAVGRTTPFLKFDKSPPLGKKLVVLLVKNENVAFLHRRRQDDFDPPPFIHKATSTNLYQDMLDSSSK